MIGRLSTNVRSGAGAVSRMGDGSLISSGDWWLSGGIDPANVLAAYQPKGAASYAASKVNLANPGTYDMAEGDADGALAPAWSAEDGWNFTTNMMYLTSLLDTAIIVSYAINLAIDSIRQYSGIITSSAVAVILEGRGTQSGYLFTSARLLHTPLVGGSVVYGNGGYLYINNSKSANGASLGANGTLRVGRYPNVYSENQHYGKIKALSFYTTSITEEQILAVSTAMAAL